MPMQMAGRAFFRGLTATLTMPSVDRPIAFVHVFAPLVLTLAPPSFTSRMRPKLLGAGCPGRCRRNVGVMLTQCGSRWHRLSSMRTQSDDWAGSSNAACTVRRSDAIKAATERHDEAPAAVGHRRIVERNRRQAQPDAGPLSPNSPRHTMPSLLSIASLRSNVAMYRTSGRVG